MGQQGRSWAAPYYQRKAGDIPCGQTATLGAGTPSLAAEPLNAHEEAWPSPKGSCFQKPLSKRLSPKVPCPMGKQLPRYDEQGSLCYSVVPLSSSRSQDVVRRCWEER